VTDGLIPRPDSDEAAVRIGGRWQRYQADQPALRVPAVVFPGAFDPLHTGHRRMAEIAAAIARRDVEFEISVENVDKIALDAEESLRRVEQFPDEQTVWLTRAATFMQKARWFPGATFVVGADTIARIAHPRYYAGDEASRDAAIDHIRTCGCSFLVFGRLDAERFRTLSGLHLPDRLLRLCTGVPAEQFRMDISSTQLRTQGADEAP
jgi:nicotinic acid mononucleotide adenylyltransferase